MKKEEIVRRIYSGAKTYQDCVLNHQFLFVYNVGENEYQYVEVRFKKEQYQHLTGTWLDRVGSNDFFDRCIAKRISAKDLKTAYDGTTELKLDVLEGAIRGIGKSSMIGIYDESRVYLKTDQLIGGVAWCIGFIPANNPNLPLLANTLLKEDVRNISKGKPYQIVFAVEKLPGEKKYTRINRMVKNIDILSILDQLEIQSKIDISGLSS